MKKFKRALSVVAALAVSVSTLFVPKMEAEAANWNLVWSDEFDGNSLNTSNWKYDIGTGDWGWGNNELQYYTDRTDNVAVSNGVLQITAKKENYNGSSYTSGRITTQGLKSFKYGRIEARIAAPNGQGYWPAFWMLGTNITSVGWPRCGEIDVFEHVNTEDKVYGTVHWDSNGHAEYGGNLSGIDVSQYHVYAVEWDEEYITWYCDDVQYHQISIKDGVGSTSEFHEEFYIILNLAVGGLWPGNPDGSTPFPSTMYVDYVRVYQEGASGSTSNPSNPGSGNTTAPSGSIADPFSNWTFYSGSDWAGAYAANTVNSDTNTTVTIASAGYGGEWGVQLYDPSLTLEVGKTYNVSFDVTSTATKKLGLYLQNNGTDLISKTVTLPANTAQSLSFTSSAAVATNGAIYLSMGNLDSSEANVATTLYITNFKVTPVGSTTSGNTNTGNTNTGSTNTSEGLGIAYASSNSATAYVNNSSWADIHYTVNGGPQMNVRMTQSGTASSYTINGLKPGDVVTYWFTYCKTAGGAMDTASATYTH